MAKKKTAGTTAAPNTETPALGLPLFFTDPQPITIERHANAGLEDQPGVFFAENTNSIPVNMTEFAECARSYPIVFTGGIFPSPVAIVGLESKNYFVKAGQWRPQTYVPAYVRKYPFALLESPDQKQWILCVDEGAEEFKPAGATHRFYDKGQLASDLAKRALDFCSLFQQHHQATVEFGKALEAEGLLVERVSTLKLTDGSAINLTGFKGIDEDKLNTLPDAKLLAWRKLGYLAMIDAVLISSVNWKYLAEDAAADRAAG